MALYNPKEAKSHPQTRVLWGLIATGRLAEAMTQPQVELVIFGSTPLARLLAGLLHAVHGRKVAFAGASHARYSLPRGLDLSVGLMTRPESWALLARTIPETSRMLAKIAGRKAVQHANAVFFADGPQGQEVLGHFYHMASAFDVSPEVAAPSQLGRDRKGVRIRDAIRLNRPIIEPALDGWLDEIGVMRLAPDRVEISADGSARLWVEEEEQFAPHAILADDAAIIAHLPLPQWPQRLLRRTVSTILTTPTAPLVERVMIHADSGTVLAQQDGGGVAALCPGDLASAAARLTGLLSDNRQLQQAGQVSYPALITDDGAPVFGKIAGSGADIVAGLGLTGAFLAPALARWLAAEATPDEADWFGRRLVDRDTTPSPVADYSPYQARRAA